MFEKVIFLEQLKRGRCSQWNQVSASAKTEVFLNAGLNSSDDYMSAVTNNWSCPWELSSIRDQKAAATPLLGPRTVNRHYLAGNQQQKDRWSRHGLGHLLNPTDPTSDRIWTAAIWDAIDQHSDNRETLGSVGLQSTNCSNRTLVVQ